LRAKLYNIGLQQWIRNPQWENSIRIVRYACDDPNKNDPSIIRACLKIHKYHAPEPQKFSRHTDLSTFWDAVKGGKKSQKTAIPQGCRAIKTTHKWTGKFYGDEVDEETGEFIDTHTWDCNDLELALSRKRKAIQSFTDVYSPLYEQHKVSVMFLTLTRCNVAPMSIKQFLKAMLQRYERRKIPVLGYFWVHEVSDTYHQHYHIAIATKRVYFRKLPKWIKFDDLWGQGTSIEFIRKSVRGYLGKYIGKSNIGRLMNYRTYGRSQKYQIPI